MKSYTTNTPVFRDTIKITEKNDRAHADIINEAPIQTFQNTLCNRQSIEQLKQSAVSTKDYDPEVSYQVGDNCLYQNTLYKCVQETTGEWNPDCWKKTNILEEMKNLEKGVLYPEFDDSGEVEGITSFTDFLDSVVSKIPLVKFLRNFKAGMKFVLHAGQLVTDCVTDRDDLPVAACTVKNLMDLYTQLNSDKQSNITGAASTITKNNLAANRVLISDQNGKLAASSITNIQLGYLNGITSNIQTQLNNLSTNNAKLRKYTSPMITLKNLNWITSYGGKKYATCGISESSLNGQIVSFYMEEFGNWQSGLNMMLDLRNGVLEIMCNDTSILHANNDTGAVSIVKITVWYHANN